MRGSDFWGQLSAGDRADLSSAARSRIFPPGALLCIQGDPTTHVFILQSGWVKIITVTHDGREVLEALRLEGEIVGEIAGQVTGYRTATVEALGTVHALLIGVEQFGDFLDLHPFAGHAYRQAMAQVQQVAYEKQRSRTLLSGAQRLAGLLLDLTEPRRPPNGAAPVPLLLLSQEELASLIGASRSTVTRALQVWRSRHIIGTDPRRIDIVDRARLQRIAGRVSERFLSAAGNPFTASKSPHQGGRLPRREFEDSARWITRVPHQHGLCFAGDFHAFCGDVAEFAFAPDKRGCRLCRLGIPRPSVRRAALRLAAVPGEGVDRGRR